MAKSLSLNEIRRRGAQFAIEWRDSPGDERQSGQSFIRDLLQVYGITATKAALYERRAKRSSTGGRGYIDALVPGLCAIEMKSTGKDLEAAVAQALDYLDDLPDAETPRFVIASDFRRFRVLDIEAPEGEDTRDFTLDELPANIDALAFLAGYQKMSFGDREQEIASVKAARIMADLYEALSDSGYDDHEASVFLVRVLFCLYADDAGVWERDLFYEFLERRTNDDGSDLGPQLAMLFQAMNREAGRRQRNLDDLIARFPYVNGGIFAEHADIPSFDKGMRDLLLQACAFNWSQISPAIFGSLFQAVKDSKARRELGEHYTTETNILKTIQPLFLAGLQDVRLFWFGMTFYPPGGARARQPSGSFHQPSGRRGHCAKLPQSARKRGVAHRQPCPIHSRADWPRSHAGKSRRRHSTKRRPVQSRSRSGL